MALRFRRSFKLFPGVRINLSKSGVSTSIGPRGASVNIGHKRTTATVGIPGSGLSYKTGNLREKSNTRRSEESRNHVADPNFSQGNGSRQRAVLFGIFLIAVGCASFAVTYLSR